MPDRSPAEDAVCSEHPERPAVAVCPRCGNDCCFACWQHPVDCCHACVMRGVLEARVPFEEPRRSLPMRVLATLDEARRPLRSAPSFAHGEVAPAIRFALLTALPLTLVAGIIPYTHTLRFGDVFGVLVLGGAGAATIARDVVQAMGWSLLFDGLGLLALAAPFVSLARAYGDPARGSAALRAVLYRAWLVPMPSLGVSLVAWAAPAPAPAVVELVAAFAVVVPTLLLLMSLRATARMACGTGPIAAWVVVLVAFAANRGVVQAVSALSAPWLPAEAPAAERAEP